MAKIDRKTQKIFGSEAGSQQITAFGTAKLDNPTYTSDLDLIQNANFLQGWDPALEDDRAPYREDDTGLWYATTRQLAYLFQNGIAEYDDNTEYDIGSLVRFGSDIYQSKVINNLGHTLSDTTYWSKFTLSDLAKRDLSNVTTLKQIHSVIVNESSDGVTSWKRVYDDGYVEQVWITSATNGQQITLPVPFRDGNYFVVGTPLNSGVWSSCYSQTATSFYVYVSSTCSIRFYACGFRV